MKNYNEFFKANKLLWNKRVDINFKSEFYNNEEFKKLKIHLTVLS